MASYSEDRLLEEPGVHSDEYSKNFGDSSRIKSRKETRIEQDMISDLTESSPPVLEPSKDEYRSAVGRRKRHQTRSSRLIESEPLPSYSGLQIERCCTPTSTTSSPPVLEPSKDESRSADGRHPTESSRLIQSEPLPSYSGPPTGRIRRCCTPILRWYRSSAATLRNSAFIYIIQVLFISIPLSAIVVGLVYAVNCPKNPFLPVFGAVVGIIGVIFMALWIFASCGNGDAPSFRQKLLLGVFCSVLLAMTIVDAVFLSRTSPSFDPTSSVLCNETFYTYAFYKEIMTAVAIVLSVLLYLPGCCYAFCCYMRFPRSDYYYSI